METTAIKWIAYRVYKNGCGEPDETIGYYQIRKAAEMRALSESTKPMCSHTSVGIEEIEIKP